MSSPCHFSKGLTFIYEIRYDWVSESIFESSMSNDWTDVKDQSPNYIPVCIWSGLRVRPFKLFGFNFDFCREFCRECYMENKPSLTILSLNYKEI